MAVRNMFAGAIGGVAIAALCGKAYEARAAVAADAEARAGLASCQQKFFSFATARDTASGLMSMTYHDFVKSLCRPVPAARGDTAEQQGVSPELERLFDLFDADSDRLLSYPEYCVLYTILSTPAATFERAFHMFDADGNAKVSAEEFGRLMRALTVDRTVELDLKQSGVVRHLFGADRSRDLPLADFQRMVAELREAIWRSEFTLADPQHRGFVTPGHLRRLVYRRDLPDGAAAAFDDPPAAQAAQPVDSAEEERRRVAAEARRAAKEARRAERRALRESEVNLDIPFDVEWYEPAAPKTPQPRAPKKKKAAAKAPRGMVTADDYVDVLTILQGSDQWLRALKLYSNVAGDDKCDVDALQRALIASGVESTPRSVSLFFRLFDLDGSGTLEPEELRYLAATRTSFFAKYKPSFQEPQRNVVQQWAYCMQQRS